MDNNKGAGGTKIKTIKRRKPKNNTKRTEGEHEGGKDT